MKYARIYRQNLISLRCGLENAQELAACCGQMGQETVDKLEEMIEDTRRKITAIERLIRSNMEGNSHENA